MFMNHCMVLISPIGRALVGIIGLVPLIFAIVCLEWIYRTAIGLRKPVLAISGDSIDINSLNYSGRLQWNGVDVAFARKDPTRFTSLVRRAFTKNKGQEAPYLCIAFDTPQRARLWPHLSRQASIIYLGGLSESPETICKEIAKWTDLDNADAIED